MISAARTRTGDCPALNRPSLCLVAALGLGASLLLSACASDQTVSRPASASTSPTQASAPVERRASVDAILQAPARLENRLSYGQLSGWADANPAPAIAAFLASCERLSARPDQDWMNARAEYAGRVGDWRDICLQASLMTPASLTPADARAFFERNFTPVSVGHSGKLTGYYEPVMEARAQPDGEFSMAIRARPGDLLTGDLGQFIAGLEGERIVGRSENQEFVPYRPRAQIEAENLGVPLAWGRPIDVFFLQIQGSGRLVYPDGGEARVRFSAHNGLPYVSIGRILIQRGELEPHNASKQDIKAWLEARGPLSWRPLFDENPRYVFFSLDTDINHDVGPIGAQGAPLTPMASLAVDPAYHAWGVPVFLNAAIDGEPNWSGLVIAQDAGGAIKGPARGDLFFGWGFEPGERAGRQNDDHARWTVLLPHHLVN